MGVKQSFFNETMLFTNNKTVWSRKKAFLKKMGFFEYFFWNLVDYVVHLWLFWMRYVVTIPQKCLKHAMSWLNLGLDWKNRKTLSNWLYTRHPSPSGSLLMIPPVILCVNPLLLPKPTNSPKVHPNLKLLFCLEDAVFWYIRTVSCF